MALKKTILLFAAIVSVLLFSNASARGFPEANDIAARLEASGGVVECWNALYELKSCTNEIILFFLNGEASLGLDCCRAIHVITDNCWPAMLTSLGFTPEEGTILIGYCDHAPASTSAPAPSPSD